MGARTISFKQTEEALFNLDSMRTRLLNERDEAIEKAGEAFKHKDKDERLCLYDKADAIQEKIDEVEDLLGKMHFGRVTRKEWERIQELVAERKMQRYVTCLNSGIDERTSAGAFDD